MLFLDSPSPFHELISAQPVQQKDIKHDSRRHTDRPENNEPISPVILSDCRKAVSINGPKTSANTEEPAHTRFPMHTLRCQDSQHHQSSNLTDAVNSTRHTTAITGKAVLGIFKILQKFSQGG
jgi:hypothetical protein